MRKDAAAELSSGVSVRRPKRITRKSSSARTHSSADSLMSYRLMTSSYHTSRMASVLHMCMKHAQLSFWRAFGTEDKCIRWCTRGCWRLVCIQIYTGWSRNSFWVVSRVMKDLCRRISDEKWRSQNHLIYEFDAVTCIELKPQSSQFFFHACYFSREWTVV